MSSKIRHPQIDSHLNSNPEFAAALNTLVSLYATSPDTSRIRFQQAIEDQLRANITPRGRTAGADNSWRSAQKSLYSGRGAKWMKVFPNTPAFTALFNKIAEFSSMGEDVSNYQELTGNSGFAWIRYSGPRGSEASPLHAFEVRINGSKVDHPKHILQLTDAEVSDLETLGGTPNSLNLESLTPQTANDTPVDEPELPEAAPAEDELESDNLPL